MGGHAVPAQGLVVHDRAAGSSAAGYIVFRDREAGSLNTHRVGTSPARASAPSRREVEGVVRTTRAYKRRREREKGSGWMPGPFFTAVEAEVSPQPGSLTAGQTILPDQRLAADL